MTMIRINLIAEKKAAAPKAAKKVSAQQNDIQENIVLIVMVLLTGLAFYVLNKRVKDELLEVQQTHKRLKSEHDALKVWEDKQLDYEIQKELLNEKIQKISSLKDTRQGPVQLMEDVANVLPDSVWLETVSQGYDRGLASKSKHGKAYEPNGKNLSDPDLVLITGRAKTTEAITNFAERIIKMDKRYAETDLNNLEEGDGRDGPKEYRFELYFKVIRGDAAAAGGGEGQP